MLRQLLKPCPRCRGNHLLELKEEDRHAVKCMHCGYFLLKSEMRFLLEDTVLHEFNQGVQAPIRSGPDSCLHEYEDGYIISSDCMDCGVCEYMCPQGAIFEAKRQFVINKALCNGC